MATKSLNIINFKAIDLTFSSGVIIKQGAIQEVIPITI